ncbi:MAG: two-component system sensor histidine kinase CreC [Burkholderiaceae bacterium]|nr:two-component system sensor histidine kinase CreC [Ideonella sp.]MCC7287032.1 two-component system sensor histidine kinase CreC [Burkholderiaceae bacterium]
MTARTRVFVGILLVYALGVGVLMWRLLADIDPRYRESAEESLVETAYLMATQIEQRSGSDSPLDTAWLEPLFRDLYARRFDANIFGIRKQSVELRAMVVDAHGIVLFDSLGRHEGQDYSQWRDIRLALAGRYGARTSIDFDGDPDTSVMVVAVPVRIDGRIAGAVAVAKPAQSIGQFVAAARRKTLAVGLTSVVAVLLLAVIVAVWLVRPFGLIGATLRDLRHERTLSLPRLGRRALGTFGAAFDEMRDALAGRHYVADYVQTLTHELKSPLSAIRGAAELLREPGMPEADRRRFLANVERETQRIQELVDRMMELTALERRRALGPTEAVALRPLLQELAGSAEAAGAPRHLRVLLHDGADVGVDGDPLLLRRAVANLLDNALDFSPDGGVVEVALARRGRRVVVTIRDHGPGIPEFADAKVFEKFFSLARPHSRRKSTGLGLAFVKQIAQLHRGRVVLRNADGGGALATLTLPCADAV